MGTSLFDCMQPQDHPKAEESDIILREPLDKPSPLWYNRRHAAFADSKHLLFLVDNKKPRLAIAQRGFLRLVGLD